MLCCRAPEALEQAPEPHPLLLWVESRATNYPTRDCMPNENGKYDHERISSRPTDLRHEWNGRAYWPVSVTLLGDYFFEARTAA